MEKKYAVLIDGDNQKAGYIEAVLKEVSSYGTLTIKRVYGNFSSSNLSGWASAAKNYSLIPVQQFENSSGKNATDICLVIDAMDILHNYDVDGFCIVSSDGDFTRLAARLRESGKEVIGFGKQSNTAKAFMAACTTFKRLETLGERSEDSEEAENNKDTKEIESEIYEIIRENEEDAMHASQLRNTLNQRHPGFDVDDYGFTKFSALLRSMNKLDVFDQGTKVSMKKMSAKEAVKIVRELIKKGNYTTNSLNGIIKKEYPDFNLQALGYKNWKRFINDNGMKIDSKNHVRLV
ncbi:MAG: NYN domain-containing protein [Eubacteriaceae bacterium]|nr:NYN domain-containing protein [Eubacteriaceae bacterium]